MNRFLNSFLLFYDNNVSGNNQIVYGFFKFLYFIVIFALILVAAYFFSRYIAKNGMIKTKNKNIKLIESISLGVDKNLYLIDVADQIFLISASQKGINLISEINAEKIIKNEIASVYKNDNKAFSDYLNDMDSEYTSSESDNNVDIVKDSIRKLKSMVRGSKSND